MLSREIKCELLGYLKQDASKRDVTSSSVPEKKCRAIVRANEACVAAGIEEVFFIAKENGLKAKCFAKDGQRIAKGNKVIELTGSNRKMLSIERVCLNILGRMSGVATLCAKAKKKAKKTRLALTRKTVPGFQSLDKKAGEAAGFWSHRKNLSDMVLLKENHLHFFTSPDEAVIAARKSMKKIDVEVECTADALSAAKAKPDIIMLDNFSPAKARNAIKVLRKSGFRGEIELSGGITLKNLGTYSKLGADFISMGEPTKKAIMVDFSMRVID